MITFEENSIFTSLSLKVNYHIQVKFIQIPDFYCRISITSILWLVIQNQFIFGQSNEKFEKKIISQIFLWFFLSFKCIFPSVANQRFHAFQGTPNTKCSNYILAFRFNTIKQTILGKFWKQRNICFFTYVKCNFRKPRL